MDSGTENFVGENRVYEFDDAVRFIAKLPAPPRNSLQPAFR